MLSIVDIVLIKIFIAHLRIGVRIIRFAGIVISALINRSNVWILCYPWILLLNGLSWNILLLTHGSTSLIILRIIKLLSIWRSRRNNLQFFVRLLLILDGVWFDKFWTLQVVMNVPILVNYNFDILGTSPNELRAIHENLYSFRVQFLNLVLLQELLFFLFSNDWEIIFIGFI